jgi:hypothetical protein
MNSTNSGTPITSTDWDKVQFGINEGTFNGDLDFFADFNTDTNVTISVTTSNDSLETSSLTGLGLFLDG